MRRASRQDRRSGVRPACSTRRRRGRASDRTRRLPCRAPPRAAPPPARSRRTRRCPGVLPLASRPIRAFLGHSPASTRPVAWYRPAQHHQRGRDHVLRDRDHVRAGRGIDRHAMFCTCIKVDVVEGPTPSRTDRDEPRSCREQCGIDARTVADDQRPGRPEPARDIRGIPVKLGVVVDVEAGAQRLDCVRIHELGDDDIGHRDAERWRRARFSRIRALMYISAIPRGKADSHEFDRVRHPRLREGFDPSGYDGRAGRGVGAVASDADRRKAGDEAGFERVGVAADAPSQLHDGGRDSAWSRYW